ncbi:hypothetical protein EFW58_03094 [Bacillus velezensis]|nr:hypothetical protein EFW58_03094 [Bacillus velezensis]
MPTSGQDFEVTRNMYLVPMPPGFRPHTKERSETRPDVLRFGEGR